MKKCEELMNMQQRLNEKLANFFIENGINDFRLTSLGNSISSGYSMVRSVKPLLLRNESIGDVMFDRGINFERHNFARAQNNNDEHFFEWLITNIKESEINKLNRNDYGMGPTSMPTSCIPPYGLDEDKIDKYYPVDISDDKGLYDIILESRDDMANVVVYNGCTGSFLDNVTRNGKLQHKLTYGINRDTYGLEAILKLVQTNNRLNGTNTQVYVCGAPNFLGLRISEIINIKLKNIVKKYANAVYVEPVKSKFFYKSFVDEKVMTDDKIELSQFQNLFNKFVFQPDVHYDEIEYLKLNNSIVQAINDNYLITRSMIDIDRELYKLSNKLELNKNELLGNSEYIQKRVEAIIRDFSLDVRKSYSDTIEFYNRLNKYLINRTPYDFHYLGKNNIKKVLKK